MQYNILQNILLCEIIFFSIYLFLFFFTEITILFYNFQVNPVLNQILIHITSFQHRNKKYLNLYNC